jgi:hypothetical protein
VRDLVTPARWAGKLDDSPQLRAEFLVGARLMGFELVDVTDADELERLAQMDPYRHPLHPQQLLIADAINSGLRRVVIEVPRRGSKTTTILAVLLGRCVMRPGYKVTFSAQTGTAGTSALEEWVRDHLDRVSPPEDLDLPPWLRGRSRAPKAVRRHEALFGDDNVSFMQPENQGRAFRTRVGNARPGILFDNGSSFMVLKPEHSAYRGKAADVSWLDEAQEINPDEADRLMAGILPLQDTRPGSQIIISGTAGEARVGPFWRYLEKLRSGDPSVGGVDFAADEETPWDLIEDEEQAMQLLSTVHPGVGTLTDLEAMVENYRDMPRPQWAREYLSLWPETFGTRAIDAELWDKCAIAKKPVMPARVAFGVHVRRGGSSAAIAAAWRTSTGLAYVEIVDHRSGTKWLPERMQELTRKHRGSTIAYDNIGEGSATATEAEMLSPKPRLRVQTYRETAAGCVQFMRDLERGTLRHRHDVGLDAAVAAAGRREMRNDRGVWLWTPADPLADITPLDAATRALRNWDQHYSRRREQSSGPIMGD